MGWWQDYLDAVMGSPVAGIYVEPLAQEEIERRAEVKPVPGSMAEKIEQGYKSVGDMIGNFVDEIKKLFGQYLIYVGIVLVIFLLLDD